MNIKEKFSSIDQSKLTADQKAFLTKIKDVTKNFTDAEMNKKVEAPLNGFIEKAKEKMPEAIKSAPVKRTSKAKQSQTRKPKRTAMSLAKEIRKEGESWNDARARASKMMKEDSKDLSKTVETELEKLSKLVKNAKTRSKLVGISGTNIKRDAVRKAKPRGARRVTHAGETSNQYGTFSNKLGRKYYESRDRHSDRLAPRYPKNAPLLENGAYLTDPNFGNFQSNVMFNKGGATTNERKHVNHDEDYEVRYAKPRPSRTGYKGVRGFALGGTVVTDLAGHTGGALGGDRGMLSGNSGNFSTGLVGETGAMSSGEMFMAGGSLNNPKNYVGKHFIIEDELFYIGAFNNRNLKRSVRYLNKLGENNNIKGNQYPMFAVLIMKINDRLDLYDKNQSIMETSKAYINLDRLENMLKNSKLSNQKLPLKFAEKVDDSKKYFDEFTMQKYELGGGLPSGVNQSYMVTEALGNPAQHFAKGGGVRIINGKEYAIGRNWTNDHRHVNKGEEHEVSYNRKGKFMGIFNDGGMMDNKNKSNFGKSRGFDSFDKSKGAYSSSGVALKQTTDLKTLGSKLIIKEDMNNKFSWNLILENGSLYKSKSGFNSQQDAIDNYMKTEYSKGGSLTNERLHVNHDEDYEVRYAKPRPSRKGYKGARKFMAGGSMETPRIYVADLEAYNSGRLVGEWLDLADYDNADELMDAIQDVLKKSGGEEYAIHDVEYVPRSMYSEYMGQRDFEQLYKMMDLAKQNDLPLEVVQDIVSQYSENAVEDFVGKYDSAVDFAEELVDDLGIQSFTDFEYYLDISETDRRLLSQDMADSYVDDIKDEDGGNRLIQEANLDVEEYEEADSSTQEEMLENAREIVYDEYYDNFYEGLGDPYYFLVEEQGMYSAEDFANANFVRVDYEKLADALEQDYTMIEYDGEVYVFNIR
jgi:antirestriction protein